MSKVRSALSVTIGQQYLLHHEGGIEGVNWFHFAVVWDRCALFTLKLCSLHASLGFFRRALDG
jgi:hypothetical protein